MGCCDNKCGCEGKSKKKVPWFLVIVAVLAILVVFNWH